MKILKNVIAVCYLCALVAICGGFFSMTAGDGFDMYSGAFMAAVTYAAVGGICHAVYNHRLKNGYYSEM